MDDLISRQAAIDAMAELQGRAASKGELTGISKAWKKIKKLPSAEPEPSQVARDIARIVENEQDMRILPKRGKWILDRSGAYCCSECMEPCATYVMMKPRDKFCKMCGAKMEVTE